MGIYDQYDEDNQPDSCDYEKGFQGPGWYGCCNTGTSIEWTFLSWSDYLGEELARKDLVLGTPIFWFQTEDIYARWVVPYKQPSVVNDEEECELIKFQSGIDML